MAESLKLIQTTSIRNFALNFELHNNTFLEHSDFYLLQGPVT